MTIRPLKVISVDETIEIDVYNMDSNIIDITSNYKRSSYYVKDNGKYDAKEWIFNINNKSYKFNTCELQELQTLLELGHLIGINDKILEVHETIKLKGVMEQLREDQKFLVDCLSLDEIREEEDTYWNELESWLESDNKEKEQLEKLNKDNTKRFKKLKKKAEKLTKNIKININSKLKREDNE